MICLWSHLALSQKTLEKQIPASGIEGIFIDTDLVFDIKIETERTADDIKIHTEVEGETFDTLLIQTEIKNGILEIHTARSPSFKKIDDKLAAHKVLSIILHLTIPENLNIEVASALASVTASGNYNYVNFNLSSGNCFLKTFRGSGIVNTERGNIIAHIFDQAIEASTRNGKLDIAETTTTTATLKLRSIDGDIKVIRSK